MSTDPFYEKLSYKPRSENWNRPAIVDGEPLWMHDGDIWFLVGCHPVIQNLQVTLRQYAEWSRTDEEVDATIQLKQLLALCERNTYLRLLQPQMAPSKQMAFRGVPMTVDDRITGPDAAVWIAEPVGV